MTEALVTKETLIGDMVSKYPAAGEVVAKYGVQCVGCHVSQFETLEQGLAGHGFTPNQIDGIINEVNEFLDSRNIVSSEFLAVSETAANKVKEFAAKGNKENFFLRATVKKGGCAGNTSSLDIVDSKNDEDLVIEAHGIKIVVDPESKPFLEGAIIEYVETLNDTGFKIHNPQARKSCACGSSFMV